MSDQQEACVSVHAMLDEVQRVIRQARAGGDRGARAIEPIMPDLRRAIGLAGDAAKARRAPGARRGSGEELAFEAEAQEIMARIQGVLGELGPQLVG